ncbi:rho guanine nucleotide exchange factor 5-like [Trachemys scripta elegans]|uniref:rho guanine nucleotide exchange factor 5-like n=1 Tax=Trachemys scripta elegans TaxID=31138 RepID=UPI001551CCC5|nr:rho guanine nucleotide exchange factor 5-like [Trachemys scripta elegans]
MKYLQPQGRQKNLNLIPIAEATAGAATGTGLKAKHWPKNQGYDTQQDVSLMESEEANGGDPFPPANSSPTEENPDPTPAKRGHYATTESVEMSTELPGSAEGAQISIAQDPPRHLSAGESAEMCGRSSNPVLSGLEQGERDLRHQRGLSEWEKDPAVQEISLERQRWDHASNSEQGKLAHPESSQYSSFPNTVPQAIATHDKNPQVPAPALHIEFPQDQKQSLACHTAVPQAQHKETSMTDTVPSQREPATKHFLVCKEVSEVHCKTETLHDDTTGDPPLPGLDVANGTIRELPPSTEAVARTDEEPSPGMDAVVRMNPMPSVNNDEKVGGLQGGGEDTDSSSSHHPPYPLLDDSQGNSQLTGGNADGKMVLSSHERGNNALATYQKTEVAARQSPSGSINLLLEEEKGADDGRAEGSTESPRECVFHILNAAKNTEQEEWQHEQLEWREEPEEGEQSEQKQPELEQEEPEWEKLEKEVKPVQEEPVWDREDQKEKRWDELEQEPGREEAEQEAPPPALNPASPSLSKQNWDLRDEGECTSSAEGTGLASLHQVSFSKDQHPGEDELSSIALKACIGGANVRAQPPAVITSESQNPVGGSSMMHSPTCHISAHWGDVGVSDPSSFISFNGQDCEETCQDNRASNGEDGHSDEDGRTVQSFDDGGAISPLCREVTSSGAGNPDSSGTLDPSSGARNLGSFGPTDPHPVAEKPAFPSHHYFTLASPSEFNSAVSAPGPSQEDADERSQVSPVGCTDLDKAPVSVQDTSSQTSYLQEAASREGASVTTSTEGVQTPHGLLTPEKGFNEESSAQPSISKAFRSPPPQQSLPKDTDEVESTPAAPVTMHLESSQAPDMALAPPNSLEKDQRHQKPPMRSFVFQGKEVEANVVHAAQHNPLLDESHLSLEVEVLGTGSALNAVPQPPEQAVVLALEQSTQPPPPVPDADQLTHPPAPVPGSPLAPGATQLAHPPVLALSSPLAPVPDAEQLAHRPAPVPSSPLAPAPDADQLIHPLAPAPSLPLTPAPDADQLTHPPAPAPSSPPVPVYDITQLAHRLSPAPGSPLVPAPDTTQLAHPLAPAPSSPLAPVPDADQLVHAPAPAPDSLPALVPDASQLAHSSVPLPSSPLAPEPDADQLAPPLAPAPSSPLTPAPDADQLTHPLTPAPSSPLTPAPSSPLTPAPDADQLTHPLAPAPSSPLTPAPDADQLAPPLAPAPSSPLAPAPDADQLTHPLTPAPSSPLTPAPDADQLAPPLAPGSPLVPVPDATKPPASAPGSPLALLADAYQLLQSQSLVPDSNHPSAPAPDIDQPLPPVSNSTPPLNCVSDSSQLLATAPNSSCPAQAPASVPDADSLAHALVPAPAVEDGEENPLLMQMTHEGVSGAQWDPVISPTLDEVDTSDSGATSLAESSDFPTLENEAPMGHSDRSPKAMGQHLATHCGKSTPDYTSRPSLGGWGTSTDSQNRNSAQPPPLLAFSNPIHFLQFSPPSPPAIRTLYRQDAVFDEPQWDQAQAGPTSVDTRNTTAPAVMIEKAEGARTCKQKMEGQGEPLHLAAQVKEVAVKHALLEKSSSWPDKKVIRVDMKELGLNSGSQENVIKHRAKSKDWHRQGLRKMSVLSDSLQEEGAHKDQPTSLDTVIHREKKSADTLDNFKRRHSKLINSSRLLYQEYSDVALNKAIQSQKRADSLAEDFELSSPSSPRLRRKVLSSQDSYLQRLSVSSNPSLWQDIPMIRGSRMLLNMSRDDQKLQEAKFELILSEASYLRSLNVAVDHFQRSSELQALLTKQERKWLFSRLQEVRDVSASFLFELEEKFEENMFNFNVCDVALRHAPAFRKVYLPYVTNQTYQEQIFQRLMHRNAKFQQVLEKLESASVCQRLSLKSFLILPFQRITRLKLLLQNILKRTPPESDEEVQATQAYDALEKLIKDCNENVQRMKSTEELIYLRQKIDFECKIFPLVSQSRRLVKCGELMTLDDNTLSPKWKLTTRHIYLHLFNDCLLLSRPREGGRFVVFDHAAFSDVRGEKCEMKLHGTNKNLFRLFLLKNNQGKSVQFLFRTETHSEKLRWISALAPPRGEPDLLENPDSPQVQCIRTYKARENDELDLEKADIIMVMQNSNDGWMEGVKLSDGERGWFPSEHVEIISSKHARQMNLKEEQRVKNAKQQVFCKK